MDENRSKRLGKLLESANEFEARQRRSSVSSIFWGVLIVLMLVAMFFAGRAFYSAAPKTDSTKRSESQSRLALDRMTPRPIPAAQQTATALAPTSEPEDALPEEVRLTAAAELHIMRAGKVVGVIYLKAGETVHPVEREGGKLMVTWGDAEGTVPVSRTTLQKSALE